MSDERNNLDVEKLVDELNKVVSKMYGEDDSIVYYARELLAILRRHGIGK